jgi:hypothetical protein
MTTAEYVNYKKSETSKFVARKIAEAQEYAARETQRWQEYESHRHAAFDGHLSRTNAKHGEEYDLVTLNSYFAAVD